MKSDKRRKKKNPTKDDEGQLEPDDSKPIEQEGGYDASDITEGRTHGHAQVPGDRKKNWLVRNKFKVGEPDLLFRLYGKMVLVELQGRNREGWAELLRPHTYIHIATVISTQQICFL